ncbi:MAG TPA: tannase/feruloyl esterase family alpha/beta hydrolase [Myxococcaceae bacterium]|nr:tannase/feruloyl esterase family alpha/beta hydrolase [Myxococcaceae bacterium]
MKRVTLWRFAVAIALATATTAWAQKIDTDERRTDPVPHRYIHGELGDAKFQLALPDDWNGKVLIGARGYSGTELSTGDFKPVGLRKGYAYALSDHGWFRPTIIEEIEDKYLESQRRILQLTKYVKETARRYYGRPASRTFMVGGSNGGHNTKMMVETYPTEYDGGVAGYGITSYIEWMAHNARFLRNYDVIASRIADIVAARAADPNWDPATTPLSPPLTSDQLQALLNIYVMPAEVALGLEFNVGCPPGSEYSWDRLYTNLRGYLLDSLAKFDPSYDPNGDGVLSLEEHKAWEPSLSPVQVQSTMRRLDNSGNLRRPVIIMHGSHDVIVTPGETDVYKRMVEQRFGAAGARNVLAVYYIPGMGHGGAEYNALIGAQLDTLEAWVDFRESGGRSGAPPPNALGGYPRD